MTIQLVPPEETSWFVAQLKPNGLKQALVHLRRQGFRVFSPSLTVSRARAGKRIEVTTPLFPGYVFVGFNTADKGWMAINSTRGIARLIIGNSRFPNPLPEQLMAGLRARCDASGCLLPPSNLKPTDRIRILSGPFADYVTDIESMENEDRLRVLIEVLGRKVRTELSRSIVEKLA